jgi:hypothetical protein
MSHERPLCGDPRSYRNALLEGDRSEETDRFLCINLRVERLGRMVSRLLMLDSKSSLLLLQAPTVKEEELGKVCGRWRA